MSRLVIERLISAFDMEHDRRTNSFVSKDKKIRLVWPPHDTDAQIAYDLQHGVIDAGIIGSNDSDMLYYFDGDDCLSGVLYNFTMNTFGIITCTEFCPQFVETHLSRYLQRWGKNKLTPWTWKPMQRLAYAVVSGCDYYRVSQIGNTTAAQLVSKVWDDNASLHDNILALDAELTAQIEAPGSKVELKFDSPSFPVAYYQWVYQLVVDENGKTTPCYPIPPDVLQCPFWTSTDCDKLRNDPFAVHRALPTWETTFHHATCGPRCIPMEGEATPPASNFDKAKYTEVMLGGDEVDTTALVTLLITTIVDWLKRVHTEEDFPQAVFAKGWARAMDSPTTIQSLTLYRLANDDNVRPRRVFLCADVDQSYQTSNSRTDGKRSVYRVVIELLTDISGSLEFINVIQGASCGCVAGVVKCARMIAVLLMYYAVKNKSAAVGRAKQAVAVTKTAGRRPTTLGEMSVCASKYMSEIYGIELARAHESAPGGADPELIVKLFATTDKEGIKAEARRAVSAREEESAADGISPRATITVH